MVDKIASEDVSEAIFSIEMRCECDRGTALLSSFKQNVTVGLSLCHIPGTTFSQNVKKYYRKMNNSLTLCNV